MSWQASRSRLPPSDDILLLPASAKTVSQAEIDALEAKRIRRLRELGSWRPSGGWHIEPMLPPSAAPEREDHEAGESARIATSQLSIDATEKLEEVLVRPWKRVAR